MFGDDRRDLLQSFERRGYLLSDAGQFEQQEERAQAEEQSKTTREAATSWRRSLGAGDTVPGHGDYDYEAMARDEVWPKPDGAGRVPLSPRYYKPGRLVLAGHDIATGKRVLSRVPLEERVMSGIEDDGADAENIEAILSQATPEDWAELTPAERRTLEAWTESQGMPVMLAAGPTATKTDASPGYGARPDGTQKGNGFLGPLKSTRGETMTEYSIGVSIDGKQMDIPTLVPTLTPDEVQAVLSVGPNDPLPESIVQKAAAHAKQRIAAGKPVFAGPDESPKQTRVGRAGVPYQPPSMRDITEPATALLDSLAGALKGGVAQTLGLPGDLESLVRLLTGGEQVMPTTEDMEKNLPPVVPKSTTDLVTGTNPREASANFGQQVGEVVGLGKGPGMAAKGVAATARTLAPTAKEMAERIAGKIGNSFRNYVVPYENAPDNLMGFPKGKPTKNFWDQRYSHVQFVRVKWADGQEIVDAVKGVNGPQAMERARRNWKDAAEILPLTREEAFKADPELQTLMESMGQ